MRKLLLVLALCGAAYGANLLNNQGGTALPVNSWTLLSPGGYDHRIVGWEKFLPVPGYGACFWGMYREVSSERNHAWICYDFKTNRWNVLAQGSTFDSENLPEGGHALAGMGIDTTTAKVYGGCCFSGSNQSTRPGGTYEFDFNGQVGRVKQTATGINFNNQLMTGVFDSQHHKLVLHGGTGSGGVAGTNEFNILTNTWSIGVADAFCAANPTQCPPADLLQGAMDFNTDDGKIYLFGGYSGIAGGLQNGVWAYDPVAKSWAAKSPGGPPAARQVTGFVYLKASNKFLMYGGGDDPTTNIRNDTWIYDPAANTWTQLSPSVNPTAGNSNIFERLVYLPEDDVVLMEDLDLSGHRLYAFRYQSGGNAGAISVAYSASAGSLNRNSDSWARNPSATVNGATLYQAWIESGSKTDSSNGTYFYPYAQQMVGGTPTNLGATYAAMASEATQFDTGEISLINISGVPHACWHQGNNGAPFDQEIVKSWGGSSWTSLGYITTQISGVQQGQCAMVGIGGTPYVVMRQYDTRTTIPARVYVVVYQWSGSAWVQLGGPLNRDDATGSGQPKTLAGSIAIVSNGTQPCVAWTEYTEFTGTNQITTTVPKTYASCWSGSAWVNQGGAANVNTSNRDFAISATFMGQLYIAFTERTATSAANLYVRTWNGSAWSTVGAGPLNRDSVNGWAYRPELINDGTNLLVTWEESGNTWTSSSYSALPPQYGTTAARPQVFVSQWNGSAWSKLGASLNADTIAGAAEHPTIAMLSGVPTVTWGEVRYGTLRQIHAKVWNGADWDALGVSNALNIVTAPALPADTINVVYSQTLAASGGTPPYTWAVTSGSLPTGLSLASSTGIVSGTPTVAATSTFTATVTDSVAATDPQAFSLTINAAPSVTSSTPMPAGTTGISYSQTLANSGGTSPFSWTITAGALPAGLSLAGATISGSPHTAGTSNFTMRVTDNAGSNASKALAITVASNLGVTTSSLPGGTVGSAYSQALAASGGFGAYNWAVTAGTLPAGLTLSGATISGTPTTSGTSNFTVRATDAGGNQATAALSILISGLNVTTPSPLSQGTVGTAYSTTLNSSGGTAPFTWAVTVGSLPAGLSLLSATGVIVGVPSSATTASFTATITDSLSATANKAFSLTINAAPSVTTSTPMAAGTVRIPYSQTLAETGGTNPLTWSIAGGALPSGLTLTASTGKISGTPSLSGIYSFTVAVNDANAASNSKALAITIASGSPVSPNPRTIGTNGIDVKIQ